MHVVMYVCVCVCVCVCTSYVHTCVLVCVLAEWVTGAPRANEYLGQVHVLTLQLETASATRPTIRSPLTTISGTKVCITVHSPLQHQLVVSLSQG